MPGCKNPYIARALGQATPPEAANESFCHPATNSEGYIILVLATFVSCLCPARGFPLTHFKFASRPYIETCTCTNASFASGPGMSSQDNYSHPRSRMGLYFRSLESSNKTGNKNFRLPGLELELPWAKLF